MHDRTSITEGRLDRFVDEFLRPAIYGRSTPLTCEAWPVPGEPIPFEDARAGHYEPLPTGVQWGRPWSTLWLHLTGTVPSGWGAGRDAVVELVIDLGFDADHPGFQCEGTAYRPDGTIIKGISPRNQHVPVDAGDGSDGIDIYVEAAANPNVAGQFAFDKTPLGDKATAGDEPLYRLNRLDIAERNVTVWELCQDVVALRGLLAVLPADLPRRAHILAALEQMVDVMDPDDVPGTAATGREALAGVLASPAYASAHTLYAAGHAHIDSAWLWPVRETIRKCARTFSNVVDLMDADPDFVFACSSAQQLAWIKDGYPELFERIRAKVDAGQFVPVGSMWVESDTNMPGSEAMARQFIEGKNFFSREFGVNTEEVWLPDSFGYSAALPQIAAAAGARWFLTQKISWNQTNKMPHHTFTWEGIDGTRIFTHFPPVDTYNSDLSARELAHAERTYLEKGNGTSSLVPFGWGDGGGGPTREMLASANRFHDLEGSPRVKVASPRDFFTHAEAEYANPPVWVGEMYLELHRGTYTSQLRTKQGNRRSEHLLREAELWAATAAVRAGADYPYDELSTVWHQVLLQQFHDILPGSSIAWVAQDAERHYADIAARLDQLIADSARRLVGDGDRTLVLNAAPHDRHGVPAMGIAEPVGADAGVEVTRAGDEYMLDNGRIRAVVDSSGRLTSLLDYATGREAVPAGEFGNSLEIYRDTPNQWDAWDIDAHYRRNRRVLDAADSVSLVQEDGDVHVVVEKHFGRSQIRQTISLAAGSDSLEIATVVDWHEEKKLLKVAFPLDVRADRSASETQFGHVFRPTHENTSWEAAKFEICAHRWIHVGEPGYGVAVANDSTYGHDITRDVRPDGGTTTWVRPSLLRAPTYPDPHSDQGEHTMRLTVRPGATIADAVEEGYRVNLTERTLSGGRSVDPLVTVSNPAVVVEAVKLADDRSGDVVVRLYESRGERSGATVAATFAAAGTTVTDLLERDIEAPAGVHLEQQSATVTLRPFQILTLRFAR
ncbi:alpha-mannosidase [Spelaeicoccus albus]|uniref:Alpha-mannosidase n=1 Tax=Spelaeicoccus albus TaxID=1280376 RepID=A0A7Z0IJA3_9MICO|nr:glycoside hydrolase family 38 C-terminal domain-containing protein [Spelaeicoccus albus]NYI69216.1 alpha-mannosidase [Spelaeicoccus albus]